MLGYILLEKMKIFAEYRTALIRLNKEELSKFNAQKGDTEGFVNIPLSINKIVFSVFMHEDENLIKISFRSLGKFPCNLFATRYFNGGGHYNASGGEFYGTMEDAVAIFEKALPEYINQLKQQNIS
jgi:phosphoesterase RecJ-like protein